METQTEQTVVLPTFTIANRRETITAKGRRESVRLAKEMSQNGGPTTVKRADGRVTMTFQSGLLSKYALETKRR